MNLKNSFNTILERIFICQWMLQDFKTLQEVESNLKRFFWISRDIQDREIQSQYYLPISKDFRGS